MFKYIKDFIDRLAESNSKTFGNDKLDCCNLNKINNVNKKPVNMSKK